MAVAKLVVGSRTVREIQHDIGLVITQSITSYNMTSHWAVAAV